MKRVESREYGINVPMLIVYVVVAISMIRATQSGEYAFLVALAWGAGLTLVGWLLFGRLVIADKKGVQTRTPLGLSRNVAWKDFTSVRYKTGSVSNGARTTAKVVLRTADGRRVVLHDGLSHWNELEALVQHRPQHEAGLDLAAAKSEAAASLWSWVAHPHIEDLPSTLYWLIGLFTAIFALLYNVPR